MKQGAESLATFAATLRFEAIPEPVIRRCEDLFLDWIGSALAGQGARQIQHMLSHTRRVERVGEQAQRPSAVLWRGARKTQPVREHERTRVGRGGEFWGGRKQGHSSPPWGAATKAARV